MMKNMRVLLSMMFGILTVCPAQAQLNAFSDPMRLLVDYARFLGEGQNCYVEVYYSLPQRSLTYKTDAAGLSAGMVMTLVVTKQDSVVHSDQWVVPHAVKDTSALASGMNLVGVTAVPLKQGVYAVKVLAQDRYNLARKDSVVFPLSVRLLPPDNIALSDLQLASAIKQESAKESPFYKNTLLVIPNVESLFGVKQHCFYYAEAYNILAGADRSDFVVHASISDAVGREVISRERPRKRTGESSVLVDEINVDQLRSGTYVLTVSLADTARRVLGSSSKKFYVYNPALGVDSALTSGHISSSLTVYAGVGEKELDTEFSFSRYEASETEKTQYQLLKGVEAKRRFMADFWGRRQLGLREQYLRRVAFANANFHILGREGFKTDRGRVYTMYGAPDDNERHPSDSDIKPYEIWSYNSLQSGVIFVFVQRVAGGDYELVHSTLRGELRDDDWQAKYTINR
jgi:GWxTD domain-containing protein